MGWKLDKQKLHLSQVRIDTAGQVFKHAILTLNETQTIAGIHEQPDMWPAIQGNLTCRVARGDEVTIISSDGLEIADRCRVVRAESGSVWLSKPLRMIQLQEVALFSTDHYAVTPVGTGFGVRRQRDGFTEPKVFQTEDAAKQDILKRQPVAA